jgi:hypothetical protein
MAAATKLVGPAEPPFAMAFGGDVAGAVLGAGGGLQRQHRGALTAANAGRT